ncbi:MAG: glycosyltransferase [Chloroflexi bacterium]|nr:glycosyltransferase [Chloroflexota bacterium]
MTTLSVIIPAFNEEEGIERVITRVLAVRDALTRMNVALEFIIVDDGSRDQTATRIAKYPQVRLVRHLKNRGYGAAIKTGFRNATGEFLAFLDADATYPPENLPDLVRAALDQNGDMIVASRMSGAKSQMPLVRRVGNLGYATLLSLIGNMTVRDTTSGMRVIRRAKLESLYPLPDGLEFTPAMSTRALHENLNVIEVAVPYSERVGRSKLSVLRDGFRFANAIVWTALAYNPVRILGLFSLALFALAGLIALYVIALRVGGTTTLNAWQLFLIFGAVLAAITGISLFSLGAMFNYLVALFHKKPVRQGLFGKPVFDPPLETHFGWIGIVSALIGTGIGIVALVLSLQGWSVERLWLYFLFAASFVIIGLQLSIAWIVMRVLDELARRDASAQRDLVESEPGNVSVGVAPARAES